METAGQILRDARERKELTASQVAASTRIAKQTIEEIENDDFSGIPAPIYVKGFLKIYAEQMGLDPAAIIRLYEQQGPAEPKPVDATGELALESQTAPSLRVLLGRARTAVVKFAKQLVAEERGKQVAAALVAVVGAVMIISTMHHCGRRLSADSDAARSGAVAPLKLMDGIPDPYLE